MSATNLLTNHCQSAGQSPNRPSGSGQHLTRSFSRLVLLMGFVLFVSACGGINTRPAPQAPTLIPSPQLANKYLSEGDTAQAANVYARLAQSETDPQKRNEYLLTATELYFDTELYNEGMRLFATFPATLNTPELQQRLQIISAYNTLAQGNHTQALQQIPAIRSISDRISRVRSLELQARAHELSNQPAQALKSRILLESNLTAARAVSLNRSKIATRLAALDINTLRTMAQTPGGTVYRGWLEYAALTRRQATLSPELYAQRTEAWRARYPNHPASAIDVANLADGSQLPSIITDQVALLLPLTGAFSEIGDSIKTGFIAARFADGGNSNIKIYDTESDTGTAIQQYERATAEGASLVIGPLDKRAVINLTAGNRISVPTLSLNYVNEGTPGHANLFQFGLLPEDEARDVAQFALKQDYRKAIVIASNSPLSQRLATAFEAQFSESGGEVLASESIEAEAYDYSQQLTRMLDINSSNSRKRRIEQLLDSDVEFEPAIRSDIEVIFMAVDSEQALLLRPQLQFHHAGKVPLVSTSHIFSGDPDADRDGDLTGIKYNDIPWTLTDAGTGSPLFVTISQSHQDSIQKLIALGIDAYSLHSQLDNMRLDPNLSLNGKTGGLSLGDGNRIKRRLEWAEFQEGIPVKILDALPLEPIPPPLQGDLPLQGNL